MEDFSQLVRAPVRAVTRLDPGYSGSGSDVWHLDIDTGPVVVRRPRQRVPGQGAFFAALHRLFGTRPWDVRSVAAAHAALAPLAPVPRVIRTQPPYLVVEHLAGEAPRSFAGLGAALGDVLGAVHSRRYPWWGDPTGAPAHPLASFHRRLAALLGRPADADGLPEPDSAVLVLADLDPSQVLAGRGRITGLVDLEALVVAPPALDFIALEYLLDSGDAAALARAYTRHHPLPALGAVRSLYRAWLLAIEFQGRADRAEWMARPTLF